MISMLCDENGMRAPKPPDFESNDWSRWTPFSSFGMKPFHEYSAAWKEYLAWQSNPFYCYDYRIKLIRGV